MLIFFNMQFSFISREEVSDNAVHRSPDPSTLPLLFLDIYNSMLMGSFIIRPTIKLGIHARTSLKLIHLIDLGISLLGYIYLYKCVKYRAASTPDCFLQVYSIYRLFWGSGQCIDKISITLPSKASETSIIYIEMLGVCMGSCTTDFFSAI